MNHSQFKACELLKKVSATNYMNQLYSDKLETIRHIIRLCREADKKDPYVKCKPYGTIFRDSSIINDFIRMIKKEMGNGLIQFNQSKFYSIDSSSKIFQDFIQLLIEEEVTSKIAKSQYIIDPIITDISLSISSSASYGADMWHRDGPLGKRIKIFFILYADPTYCSNLAYVPATYDLHCEPTVIDHIPRIASNQRSLMDKNFEEQLIHISSNRIEETQYANGDIFFFNTNMYHKRINCDSYHKFSLVNRIALVAELISESRLKTFESCRSRIPAGQYKIKVN